MVKEEGLEQSWEKHRAMHASLYENLSGLGLEFVVDASYRLPQLNLVKVPDGVDEAAVRQQLLQEFNLEIGAGLGAFAGKVWRIGLMGYSARQENVQLCTSALRSCLS
jgi:alanine-glyoxylate transaminase/serine-glyoxylate transaminase/serine-pyruvate transaminase